MTDGKMSFKEFQKFRLEVCSRKFEGGDLHPLLYGIQRIDFEQERLRELIRVGETVDALTVKAKIAQWRNQLQKLERNKMRLQKLREELAIPSLATA
jgi:hypothetical protein